MSGGNHALTDDNAAESTDASAEAALAAPVDAMLPTPQAAAGGVEDSPLTVEHLADAPERSLIEAAEAAGRNGAALRIRTALQVFNPETKPYGAFKGWRGQSWIVTVPGVDAARTFRQVIEVVFDLIRMGGIDQTLSALQDLAIEFPKTK